MCMYMHVEATVEHQLTSSSSFCLVALRQGLSLIQKLDIITRLPGQAAQDSTVPEVNLGSSYFQKKHSVSVNHVPSPSYPPLLIRELI